jgi:predicted nuclease of predicted toxin-antitoxin system
VKFLADMGVSMTTVEALRTAGAEVVHLREEGLLTLPDDQILARALKEHRVILTFDLDFGELLAAGGGNAPSVVLFRMHDQTPAAVTPRLFRVLENCSTALETGAIIIVEEERYRVRPLPILPS